MSRFRVLFKSTAVRLSALYILLFALCAATLVFYVTAMSERLLTGQIRDAVQQEVNQVKRAYDAGGLNLLLRTMERRSRQPGANLYVIASPSGDISRAVCGSPGSGSRCSHCGAGYGADADEPTR